ncbi:MAG: Micrococcal nuclease, partial [Patescibacteria group bacterium]|nr:Micrococcal nuclease [Patescibacteria group bacterium]
MDELSDHIPKRRQRRRRKHLAGGLITSLIVAVIGFVFTAPPQAKQAVLQAQPGLWHVAKAVDGDTLHVTQGAQKETVRLLGVDTPETHDPRKPVQCFGLAAATHTKATLEGQNVRLEPDPTNSDRD